MTNWEEPTAYFGGHYNVMFPKNVYWTQGAQRRAAVYGDDAAGSARCITRAAPPTCRQMLDAEGGYWFHSHPRTKGTTGYPDAIFDKAWVKNDRYLGIAFKPAMGDDLSDPRMCAWRCFDAIDTMNNLYANTGHQAEVPDRRRRHVSQGTRRRHLSGPSDQLREARSAARTHRRLEADPPVDSQRRFLGQHRRDPDQELRGRGHGRQADGVGRSRVHLSARVRRSRLGRRQEGRHAGHQATDTTAHGTKKISIPFDATGKAWVRFAVWDSAGNGAFVQPSWLNAPPKTTSGGN